MSQNLIAVRGRYWFDRNSHTWLAVKRNKAPACLAQSKLWQQRSYEGGRTATYAHQYQSPIGFTGMRMALDYSLALPVIIFLEADSAEIVAVLNEKMDEGVTEGDSGEACGHAYIAMIEAEAREKQERMQRRDEGQRLFGTRDGNARGGHLSNAEQARRRAALAAARGQR